MLNFYWHEDCCSHHIPYSMFSLQKKILKIFIANVVLHILLDKISTGSTSIKLTSIDQNAERNMNPIIHYEAKSNSSEYYVLMHWVCCENISFDSKCIIKKTQIIIVIKNWKYTTRGYVQIYKTCKAKILSDCQLKFLKLKNTNLNWMCH